MQPPFEQMPLTADDRKRIHRSAIIFYVFGTIGTALIILSLYLITQQVAVFYFILLLIGILLVTVLAITCTWVYKDIKSGKKNIFFGTVSDRKEIYKVKVSSQDSSFNSEFESEYNVKFNDYWHEVKAEVYKNSSPGQQVRIEKTTQSGFYLGAEVTGTALSRSPKAAHREFIEGKEHEVSFTQVAEKLSSNVKITNYQPRKTKGESGHYLHYLVIENQLYELPISQYDSIPVCSPVEILKDMESNKIKHVYAYTFQGERVSLEKGQVS
ncbi:MAG: hypothetical protein RIC35_07330 [Marinoscillum sp.]